MLKGFIVNQRGFNVEGRIHNISDFINSKKVLKEFTKI